MSTPEKESGDVAGVSVASGLIAGGGGARKPPAGEPAKLSADASVYIPAFGWFCGTTNLWLIVLPAVPGGVGALPAVERNAMHLPCQGRSGVFGPSGPR